MPVQTLQGQAYGYLQRVSTRFNLADDWPHSFVVLSVR